jgi:hypothetical protein
MGRFSMDRQRRLVGAFMTADIRIRTSLARFVSSAYSDEERKDRLWGLFRDHGIWVIDPEKCDEIEAPICRRAFERQVGVRE